MKDPISYIGVTLLIVLAALIIVPTFSKVTEGNAEPIDMTEKKSFSDIFREFWEELFGSDEVSQSKMTGMSVGEVLATGGQINVTVNKTTDDPTAASGDLVTFLVNITNHNTTAFDYITLNDSFPGLLFNSSNCAVVPSGNTSFINVTDCIGGALIGGGSFIVELNFTVSAGVLTEIENAVVVTASASGYSDDSDQDSANISILDASSSVVAFSSPLAGEQFSAGILVTITMAAIDEFFDTAWIRVTSPLGTFQDIGPITGSLYQTQISPSDPGIYHVTAWANDTSGNQDFSAATYFMVSEDSPVVGVSSSTSDAGVFNFTCVASDDVGLANISLYHNVSGSFTPAETKQVSGSLDLQVPFGGLANVGQFIGVDSAGSVYVGGNVDDDSQVGQGYEFAIIKYDKHGVSRWSRFMNWSIDDSLNSIAVDSADDVIVVGHDRIHNDRQWRIVKLDGVTGVTIWSKAIDWSGSIDIAYSLVTYGTDMIVGGWARTPNGIEDIGKLVKLNSAGDEIWNSTLNYTTQIERLGLCVDVDSSGDMISGGWYNTMFGSDWYVNKVGGSDGALIWETNVSWTIWDGELRSCVFDNNDDILVIGDYSTGASSDTDAWGIVKFDGSTGAQMWNKSFDWTNKGDTPMWLDIDQNNTAYVAGFSNIAFSGSTDGDWRLLILDSAGNEVSNTSFDKGSNYDQAYSIILDNEENPIVVGTSSSSNWSLVQHDRDVGEWQTRSALQSPFSFSVSGVPSGNYSWGCKATDAEGNSAFGSNGTFYVEPDMDGDGIPDVNDTLDGDESTVVTTGVSNLNITVGGNSVNGTFTGSQEIIFSDNSGTILNFSHDFSSTELNLSAVSLEITSTSIIVDLGGQLQSGETKSIYLDDTGFISICVEDAPITSISQISSGCTGTNETDFTSCMGSTGVTLNGVTCRDLGTRFVFEGLSHSGVKATPPTPPSGGGGGGGGSSRSSCREEWACGDWGECKQSSTRARTCTKTKECFDSELPKPKEIESCAYTYPESSTGSSSTAADEPEQGLSVGAPTQTVIRYDQEEVLVEPEEEKPAIVEKHSILEDLFNIYSLAIAVMIIFMITLVVNRKVIIDLTNGASSAEEIDDESKKLKHEIQMTLADAIPKSDTREIPRHTKFGRWLSRDKSFKRDRSFKKVDKVNGDISHLMDKVNKL